MTEPPTPTAEGEAYELRQKIAGWHFAKECLSKGEREILAVAERLDHLCDARDRELAALRAERDYLAELEKAAESRVEMGHSVACEMRRLCGDPTVGVSSAGWSQSAGTPWRCFCGLESAKGALTAVRAARGGK